MILSIRHRILIPFLFINLFLVFTALFFSIEYIHSRFDNKLYKLANTQSSQYEFLLNQMIVESYLSSKLNKPYISSKSLYQANAIISDLTLRFDPNSGQMHIRDSLDQFPINLDSFNALFGIENSMLYYQINNQLIRVSNQANVMFQKAFSFSPSDANKPLSNIEFNDSSYSSIVIPHSSLQSVFIQTFVPNASIYSQRNVILLLTISSILVINCLIIFTFIMILNRITISLSQITNNAKKIAKGQITSPIKVMSNDEIGLLAQSFNNMLNNVQTKTAELIHERNRSKMIVTQLPDGIIVTDLENKLLLANRSAESMLGFSSDRAFDQDILKYFQDDALKSLFKSHFKRLKDSSISSNFTFQNESYQITFSPLLDTSYQKNGIIIVIRNVTDEQKIQSLKDSFLRTVTHELKTPLTSIIGFLDIILKESHGNLNSKQKDFLSISILNSKYLKKLINDLLELSTIHSGKSTLTYERFNIQSIIDDLLKTYYPIIQNRKNIISVNYQDPKLEIFGDKDKIYKIIENLIINANKFTENGTIECFINQTDQFSTIIFKDSGMGMSNDQKTRLLNLLEKKQSSDFSFEGISLELSLVKELINLHHGKIFVESEESRGSVFTIILPNSAPSETASYENELVHSSYK